MTVPRPSRRRLLAALVAPALGAARPGASIANPPPATGPARVLRLLVGFPAGGGTDAIARLLAEPLREGLGVPVLVENRPGAGGQIAAQLLRTAVPDGSTLLLSHDHTISILPLVTPDPGYDPERDFVPVAGFATFFNAVALGPAARAPGLTAFFDAARASRKPVAVGVPAPASVPELLVQSIARRQSLDLAAIPYKGSAPLIAELAGGQIPAAIASVPDLIEHHRAGRLRIAAVLGPARQGLLPEVPTLDELGISGFDAVPYYGLFAPGASPPAARARIASALSAVLSRATVRERLVAWGLDVQFMPGAELAARERRYRAHWAERIQAERASPAADTASARRPGGPAEPPASPAGTPSAARPPLR
jgi:tripartite-type tricarboxylate transporter receptor subunit TctC